MQNLDKAFKRVKKGKHGADAGIGLNYTKGGIMLCNIQHDGARKVADIEGQVNELTRAVRHQAEVIEVLQSQLRDAGYSGVRSSVSTAGGVSSYDVYGNDPRPGDGTKRISLADIRKMSPRDSAQSRDGIRDGGSFAGGGSPQGSPLSRDARRLLSVDM